MSRFEEDVVRPVRELVRELDSNKDELDPIERQLLDDLKAAIYCWDHPEHPSSNPPASVL